MNVFSNATSDIGPSLRPFLNAGDGAWAVDDDQRIVLWNEAAEEQVGYSAQEAVGRFCYDLLVGRDLGGRPVCRERCPVSERARAGRSVRAFNLRVQCADGHVAWINVSGIVVRGKSAAGRFAALVHLFRSIGHDGDFAPPLRIRLLGPVVVQRADGSRVGEAFLRRAKVRALFSLLALRRGQSIHRDRLLAALWPDMARSAALHNLNTTIYDLRHSLEPALEHGPDSTYVQNQGSRYLLVGGETHWLDVEDFESKLATAQRDADPVGAEELYRSAIALYRGEFLADLDPYLLACWPERERYHQLYLAALQGLGDTCAQEQRDDEATQLYLRVVAEDPCRETAVQALMHLDLRAGDRSSAISRYEQLERNLRRELELEPSEQTRVLRRKAAQD